MLEATITPKLNVIKVTHTSSKEYNTLISKKFLITSLPKYIREIYLLFNRTKSKILKANYKLVVYLQ